MLTGANGRYSGRSYEAIPADASVVLRRRWRWRHGWTVRGVKKETDGKEKESCCIRKLFIFLRGMVNTKEDAFLVGHRSAAASSLGRRVVVSEPKFSLDLQKEAKALLF